MPRKGSVWLYGCGIGCVVAGLGLCALFMTGWFFIRNMLGGFEQAESARVRLEQAHGAPEAFVPWPGATLPADRLQLFLVVRERLAPHRAILSESYRKLPVTAQQMKDLDQSRGFDKFVKGFFVGRDAISLVQEMGRYTGRRDEALLESGMGMGEYMYLYCLAYYSWLGRSPMDGPPASGSEGKSEGMSFSSTHHVWRVHDDLLGMLRRQQAAGDSSEWSKVVAAEIAAMEKDEGRMPWQGSVPGTMASALEPLRDRLSSSYDPLVNAFELMRLSKRNRFSYEAE